MGISYLTARTMLNKHWTISDDLLTCECNISLDDFIILCKNSNNFTSLMKESLSIPVKTLF